MSGEVRLKVDGMIYGGWTSIDIRRSLDHAADTFALGLTDRWAGEDTPRPIRMGSACEVWIGEEKLITGYVDDVNPSYDGSQRSIEIEGRSKVADLIDCALATNDQQYQFNEQNFAAIAQRLAKHFGIKTIDLVGKYKPARHRNMEAGQRVFEFLEEVAREEAVLLVSDADGNLVITRASNERITTALELGQNTRSAQGRFSMRDRFSQYRFLSQGIGWNERNGEASAHIVGQAEDLLPRFRPTTTLAEDASTPEAIRRRAEWQRNVAYGRSMQVTYTVAGWRHDAGLWEPNRLVRIVDAWMGLDGVWWLISAVRFRLDENGSRTEITVMPKEAFDLIPLPPKDDKNLERWQP